MSIEQVTENSTNETWNGVGLQVSSKAYYVLSKEVARRRQAGLTASRKGVATEAIMAKYGSPATQGGENE